MFVFWNRQMSVVSGISTTQFNVSLLDAAEIKVGFIVKIHDDLYNYQSSERIVVDVTGTVVTVDADLGLTPILADKIELLGFADNGKPYRWL
jgi:hypothetical protein